MLNRAIWLPAAAVRPRAAVSGLSRTESADTVRFALTGAAGTFTFLLPLVTMTPGVSATRAAPWRAVVTGLYLRAQTTGDAHLSSVSLWEDGEIPAWRLDGLNATLVDRVVPTPSRAVTTLLQERPQAKDYRDWFFPLVPTVFEKALCLQVEVVMNAIGAEVVWRGGGVEMMFSRREA